MTTSTEQATTEATATYNTGKVKAYLERSDVKLMTVMMETGINVGRLAEIVNGNYPATAEEKRNTRRMGIATRSIRKVTNSEAVLMTRQPHQIKHKELSLWVRQQHLYEH